MPPRTGQTLTSSFSVTDVNNEVRCCHSLSCSARPLTSSQVVCPLQNQDGSQCRKRCLGVSTLHPYRSLAIHCHRMLTMLRPTGEAIPLHAGAHSPRPPRILHP